MFRVGDESCLPLVDRVALTFFLVANFWSLGPTWKYDIILKTGSTLCIATPLEKDRTTVIGSVHEILVKIDLLCSSGDMLAD